MVLGGEEKGTVVVLTRTTGPQGPPQLPSPWGVLWRLLCSAAQGAQKARRRAGGAGPSSATRTLRWGRSPHLKSPAEGRARHVTPGQAAAATTRTHLIGSGLGTSDPARRRPDPAPVAGGGEGRDEVCGREEVGGGGEEIGGWAREGRAE